MPDSMISVLIPTFGDESRWEALAERAMDSAENQTMKPLEVLRQHGPSLATTRNQLALEARGDWLCHLDADDMLAEGFVEEMQRAIDARDGALDVLYQPATQGFHPDGTEDFLANVIAEEPLIDRNYLVVSTLIPRQAFLDIGGFDESLSALEDWQLFIRLRLAGYRSLPVSRAVLWVYVNPQGRNFSATSALYRQIRSQFAKQWEQQQRAR